GGSRGTVGRRDSDRPAGGRADYGRIGRTQCSRQKGRQNSIRAAAGATPILKPRSDRRNVVTFSARSTAGIRVRPREVVSAASQVKSSICVFSNTGRVARRIWQRGLVLCRL